MSRQKKDINIEIGSRLKNARENLNYTQSQFAELLGICDEHYRKIENGSVGLTMEKVYTLYQEAKIDPNYLIIGENQDNIDIEYCLNNCSKEQRKEMFTRLMTYIIEAID